MKKILPNLLLLLTTSAALLFFGEWILGRDYFLYESKMKTHFLTHDIRETDFFLLTGKVSPPYLMPENKAHHFWWNATYKTNERGYLGDAFSDPRHLNLLFLGDSVGFGLGVQPNETYAEQLKRLIPGARVANMAAPGYNVEDEIAVLKRALLKGDFWPDIVVIQFGPNDFDRPTQTARKSQFLFYERIPTKVFGDPSGLYRFLLEHSHLFFRLNDQVTRRLTQKIPLRDYPNRYQEVKDALTELQRLGQQQRFRVLFLNVPVQHEKQGYSPERLQEIESLNAIFEDAIDMRPLLNKPDQWYDPAHPNVAGHTIIAETLYGYLQKKNLLKQG